MSNPFETNKQETDGPLFGNAYEDSSRNAYSSPQPPPVATPPPMASPALPARNKNNNTSSPFGTQRMPSPSDYNDVNAWQQESNKVLDEPYRSVPSSPQNAYQYAGTSYGNQNNTPLNAYSQQTTGVETTAAGATTPNKIGQMDVEDRANTPYSSNPNSKYHRIRYALRLVLFIFAIGHLGFAAGASPFSGEKVPFNSSACFYFLFAVAILSIIYSGFHIGHCCYRRFKQADKVNRVILGMCDFFMALMWGIGIIVEIAKYHCPVGWYNHWCDFYNASIFFGFVSFVIYVVMFGWDIAGSCINR